MYKPNCPGAATGCELCPCRIRLEVGFAVRCVWRTSSSLSAKMKREKSPGLPQCEGLGLRVIQTLSLSTSIGPISAGDQLASALPPAKRACSRNCLFLTGSRGNPLSGPLVQLIIYYVTPTVLFWDIVNRSWQVLACTASSQRKSKALAAFLKPAQKAKSQAPVMQARNSRSKPNIAQQQAPDSLQSKSDLSQCFSQPSPGMRRKLSRDLLFGLTELFSL